MALPSTQSRMPVSHHHSPSRTVSRSLNRAAHLTLLAGRDVLAVPASRTLHPGSPDPEAALERAIRWLCHTHDATGRRGSSKGYSLLRGWLPAYPETTGYVIGTLLEYSDRVGARPDLIERAREMGAWETEIQEPDGGVMLGDAETYPRRSIVFNTGMVLHGWLDLRQHGHNEDSSAAERAARFLTTNLREDGTWSPEVEYNHFPHTYNSRVAWAMVRWARYAGASKTEEAAVRQPGLGGRSPTLKRLVRRLCVQDWDGSKHARDRLYAARPAGKPRASRSFALSRRCHPHR